MTIRPVGYEFPEPFGDRWDDNWLVIEGRIDDPDGSWEFREPVLLTCEAPDISSWLRSVADGGVAPVRLDEDSDDAPQLGFMEPNLAFSLQGVDGDVARVRIHFSLESAPSWLTSEERECWWRYFVVLGASADELRRGADDWDRELERFPER